MGIYPIPVTSIVCIPGLVNVYKLDDGWPESVEEQDLLLLVWRRNFRNSL